MTSALKREIKALAFDQYGTVVDMQKGLTDAVAPFLKQKGWDDALMTGDAFSAFLKSEQERVTGVLKSAGMLKQ